MMSKETQSEQPDEGESARIVSDGNGESDADLVTGLKKKRTTHRGKVTRAINRVRRFIEKGAESRSKIEKELAQIRKDFELAREYHAEMYNYIEESQTSNMDEWEDLLINDFYDIEAAVEEYLRSISDHSSAKPGSLNNEQISSNNKEVIGASASDEMQPSTSAEILPGVSETEHNVNAIIPNLNDSNAPHDSSNDILHEFGQTPETVPLTHAGNQINSNQPISSSGCILSSPQAFDNWIDDLTEFQETVLPHSISEMSIAQALYKLEASKDIPSIELIEYDGDPLTYVEFLERFKLHIHDKPHLNDNVRMIQLKMHLTGRANRAVSGLGSQGKMYATALKTLKEQFGTPSAIARAHINKLLEKRKIQNNDRQALQELSFDVVNCVATLKQINHLADANSIYNLRNIVKRLPDNLIDKWKAVVSDIRERGQVPSLEHIGRFLRKRVKAEFDPDFGDIQKSDRNPPRERRGISAAQKEKKSIQCYVCSEDHRVIECPAFSSCSNEEKIQHVKKQRLCFSCLNRGHMTKECRSKVKCGVNDCTHFHHRLLHVDSTLTTPSTRVTSARSVLDNDGIMPVVRVRFNSSNGKVLEGNVLIDSGAGTTVIRKSFARALGLQGKKEKIDIAVVGGERITQDDSRRVKFWISPLNGTESFPVEAHEIGHTIINVPALDRAWLSRFDHLKGIELSHRAGPIDLILGVQYSHLHAESEVRQGLPFQPVAKKTKLGWHVIGPDKMRNSTASYLNFTRKINFETFYEFETIGVRAPDCKCPVNLMTSDGKKAMELFENSCEKLNGRYVIGLPWKKNPAGLPSNYPLARQRLESLERSLAKNPTRAKMYDEAIKEYEKNGWARKLKDGADKSHGYYLPHHGVYRPEKKSTPLRIVFDPACLYKNVSLNSFLYKGPCLIGDLLGVLLRFREEEVAFVGDISKMFLQILLRESDCQVHRFLWRNMDTSKEPTTYVLLRVTFGDKPSPDMASFVMLKIAEENKSITPEASKILERDRYVDDLIHSCPTVEDGKKRIEDVERILKESGFSIKEWHCSPPELQEFVNTRGKIKIPAETQRATVQQRSEKNASPTTTEVNLDKQDGIKALGVSWNPKSDTIHFQIQLKKSSPFTKRSVLSNISRIFDPLGLATAVTIKARMALQEVWKMKKYDWDDPLPKEQQDVWSKILKEMESLSTIRFPRCLKPDDASGLSQLHVFSDASVHAYGAAAYLRWPRPGGAEVRLVAAKARVAPIRQTTIPRLELMAALLASRLARTVYDEFKIKPSSVVFWTDSMIVLAWIQAETTTLKPFVGVRVTEIQTSWEQRCWRFVPTDLNPADDLSRGIPVQKLSERWMNGPAFLRDSPEQWPSNPSTERTETPEVKSPKPILSTQKPATYPIIDPSRFSNWGNLCRVTAYCFRFVKNVRDPQQRQDGPLEPKEIESAETYWIKAAQKELGDWKQRCKDLAPFKAEEVVRVGGRLTQASLQFGESHPVLLPREHVVSKLVARDAHNRVLHAGRERTLSECRRKFWILRGRSLVKKMVQDCVTCRKLRQYPYSTLMADLPADRLKLFAPPFTVTGVDLFGPFFLRYGRNKKVKAWGAVFTCATVRAIHLEIVQDLSTEAFLHALRRFTAHHGWPQTIISDNGTSFVGTERELRKLLKEGRKSLEDFAMTHKLKWKFNTPGSPHQGGFFESMVKLTKSALKVTVGQQTLSWNEMATVFAEVECLVNSRPLGYPSDDVNDLQPLTPNHLILGRATPATPQGPFREVKNGRKRFEYVQSLIQQFWQRFQREYLQRLMRRSKWQQKERQLKVDDIVMMVEDNLPRGKWNLARIVEVFPGKDGVVRNIRVQTKSGTYKRSVQKCCLLLEEESS